KDARDLAVLVDHADLAIGELHDLKVSRDRLPAGFQQEVDPRVLELRHGQVMNLDCGPAQRIEDPVHARLENGVEAPVTELQATLVLGDGDLLQAKHVILSYHRPDTFAFNTSTE